MKRTRHTLYTRRLHVVDGVQVRGECFDGAFNKKVIDYEYIPGLDQMYNITPLRHSFDVDRLCDQVEWMEARRGRI